ncbi:MAG TPA: bifunctional diguanylate cyclase/phosphodiesterase [Polyangia bacterium]|nr:bifunctional diguanylate cyclase/phosphodiesterase [Polyangia bacterium]
MTTGEGPNSIAPPPGAAARDLYEALVEITENDLVTSHFQPIVDLHHGSTIAWEVLSRGPAFMPTPSEMFGAAERLGLSHDLENACRRVAFRTIARLPAGLSRKRYFLNVSPHVISTEGPNGGALQTDLARYGLEQSNLVMEITERESIVDYEGFERHIRDYVQQGFRIALDDFGAGHSGLVTLVTCSPHFLKLDMSLSRDIHRHAYKQHLLKSLVAFAGSVDAALIAEGVETWDELETLARFGVRYAQGYLLGRPAPSPAEPATNVRLQLRQIMRQFNYREADLNEAVGPLVIRCATLREREKRGEDIDRMFRKEPNVDHVVVVRDDRPTGLITRRAYYAKTGGPVGYHLFQWKPAEEAANPTPLVVEDSMSIPALAKLAMERPPEEIYDPVLVVNAQGVLIGSVTIRQLIMRSTSLEVQSAQSCSPLTGLPGNRTIERWILEAIDQRGASVVYADLDRFKEYNDCYGFLRGDEMIRCAARVLSRALAKNASAARLGHIGGDDFVVVSPVEVATDLVQAICRQFDEEKRELFDANDLQRGYFVAVDRKGNTVNVPLVTLSVAVVQGDVVQEMEHPGALAQLASSLKRKVKESTAREGVSGYLFERRRFHASVETLEHGADHDAPAPGTAQGAQ